MNNLIVIIGPTAVGKTKISLALADRFNCPIISADSRQMYKGLEIGTAMPTKEELQRCKHYFVAQLDVDDYYSAARYEQEVMKLLEEGFPKHPTMLLTGGSMLYIDSVCNGIDDIPTVDEETRNFIKEKYANEGLERLCDELRLLDPEYYNEVDRKNPKRVMHALEICYMTGRTYTSFRTRAHTKSKRPFNIIKIGLRREREELYQRINDRVDQMINDGLLMEAQRFYPMREKNSLNTVGYKELFKYIDGEWELPFAIEKIKQNTRIYSRKQTTWYRKDTDIQWFHPDDTESIIKYIEENINKNND